MMPLTSESMPSHVQKNDPPVSQSGCCAQRRSERTRGGRSGTVSRRIACRLRGVRVPVGRTIGMKECIPRFGLYDESAFEYAGMRFFGMSSPPRVFVGCAWRCSFQGKYAWRRRGILGGDRARVLGAARVSMERTDPGRSRPCQAGSSGSRVYE